MGNVNILMVFKGMVVEGRGEILRWRKWKGEVREGSLSWMRTAVSKDGQLWRKHALRWIHHIWMKHSYLIKFNTTKVYTTTIQIIFCLGKILTKHYFCFSYVVQLKPVVINLTWLSQLDTEVVSHRSVGVRCDGIVAMLLCPLDQSLRSWW